MVRGRRPARRNTFSAILGLAVLAVAAALGPRLMEGYGALQWTRFHAARVDSPRATDHARRAGRAAARTVGLTAPLPWAAQAARTALDAGRSLESSNGPAASSLYAEVRSALDHVSASPVRGFGLSAITAEARSLDEAARPARSPGP